MYVCKIFGCFSGTSCSPLSQPRTPGSRFRSCPNRDQPSIADPRRDQNSEGRDPNYFRLRSALSEPLDSRPCELASSSSSTSSSSLPASVTYLALPGDKVSVEIFLRPFKAHETRMRTGCAGAHHHLTSKLPLDFIPRSL